jgi:CheY-like chemotaxis protein
MISLDLVMPRKSGIKVIHELRRRPEWARIPLVIVTGHAQDRDVRRDLDQVMASSVMSGSSMYLEKPVTPQRYLQHICQVLGIATDTAPEPSRSELQQKAEQLLADADADTLAEILETLKKGGERPG